MNRSVSYYINETQAGCISMWMMAFNCDTYISQLYMCIYIHVCLGTRHELRLKLINAQDQKYDQINT